MVWIGCEPISLEECLQTIGHNVGGAVGDDSEAGALVTFSGIVRGLEGESRSNSLQYEHYEGMAQREVLALLAEARSRWPVRRAAIYHRVGSVEVGGSSVIVAVSAGHRAEAFEAARFLIDEIKARVPIWKSAAP
ncbi:molybdenum cofactor biosynthesis protein MoaE [soil metagenome]